MIRQQLQSSLGISSLKGIDTYGANGKPDSTSERSIFIPPLYLVNPVSSDWLALNKDGVLHYGALSVSGKETRLTAIRVYQKRVGWDRDSVPPGAAASWE